MSEVFSAERLLLNVAEWAAETTSPNAGAGTPAAIGSWWQRQGAYPGAPTEVYLKGQAQDTGWLKQNVVNLNVFNVKDPAFGAKGDGITDDTAAIQAAVNAANAAGGGVVYIPPVNVNAGQFYLVNYVDQGGTYNPCSIALDNVHNVTIMGDGYASLINMAGNSQGQTWSAFELRNGSSNIAFENFQISGAGITNPAATEVNYGVSIRAYIADANTGPSQIVIRGMSWGSFPASSAGSSSSRIQIQGDSNTRVPMRIDILRNGGGGACGRVAMAALNYGFLRMSENFGDGATNTGLRAAPTAGAVPLSAGPTMMDCNIMTVAFNGSLSISEGTVIWNVNSNGGVITAATGNVCETHTIRGNVAVTNIGGTGIVQSTAQNLTEYKREYVGNVIVALPGGNRVSLRVEGNNSTTAIMLNAVVSDNVVEASNNNSQAVSVLNVQRAVVDGNIVIHTLNAATGSVISITPVNESVAAVGNLAMATGVNTANVGIDSNITAAVNMSIIELSYNMSYRGVNGFRFTRSAAQLYLDWRACNNNQAIQATTQTVFLPSTNAGVTQAGPAGPGAQIATVGTTPVGNVSAPQGSMCADTAGGQATSIWYKETGVGVSGGTAGWFGIGGFDLVFGALNLSTTLTALFLAPGGDGLATPSTTEIQAAVTRPATVRNLRSKVAVAGTGAGTVIHTVRKNGVDTTLTVTVTNTSTTAVADTTHSFTVVAGDLLSVKITKTATITTAQTNCADTIEIV